MTNSLEPAIPHRQLGSAEASRKRSDNGGIIGLCHLSRKRRWEPLRGGMAEITVSGGAPPGDRQRQGKKKVSVNSRKREAGGGGSGKSDSRGTALPARSLGPAVPPDQGGLAARNSVGEGLGDTHRRGAV